MDTDTLLLLSDLWFQHIRICKNRHRNQIDWTQRPEPMRDQRPRSRFQAVVGCRNLLRIYAYSSAQTASITDQLGTRPTKYTPIIRGNIVDCLDNLRCQPGASCILVTFPLIIIWHGKFSGSRERLHVPHVVPRASESPFCVESAGLSICWLSGYSPVPRVSALHQRQKQGGYARGELIPMRSSQVSKSFGGGGVLDNI
jgi:hypothetical protein